MSKVFSILIVAILAIGGIYVAVSAASGKSPLTFLTRASTGNSVSINDGAKSTDSLNVTLSLSAKPEATKMKIANSTAELKVAKPVSFIPQTKWTLAKGESGKRTVYVSFNNNDKIETTDPNKPPTPNIWSDPVLSSIEYTGESALLYKEFYYTCKGQKQISRKVECSSVPQLKALAIKICLDKFSAPLVDFSVNKESLCEKKPPTKKSYRAAFYTCSDNYSGKFDANTCLGEDTLMNGAAQLCKMREASLVKFSPDTSTQCETVKRGLTCKNNACAYVEGADDDQYCKGKKPEEKCDSK